MLSHPLIFTYNTDMEMSVRIYFLLKCVDQIHLFLSCDSFIFELSFGEKNYVRINNNDKKKTLDEIHVKIFLFLVLLKDSF